ncbi:hypothetical protein ACWFR5_44410 [Streptomyces sp. NPDC055092]
MLHELADHIESLAVAQARALDISRDAIADDLTVTAQSLHGRYAARPSPELQQHAQEVMGALLQSGEHLNAAKNRHPNTPPPAHADRAAGCPGAGQRSDHHETGAHLDTVRTCRARFPDGGLAACGPAVEGVTAGTVPVFGRVFRSHSGSEIGNRCLDTGIERCVS